MSNKYVYSAIMLLMIGVLLFSATSLYMKMEGKENSTMDKPKIVTSFFPVYISTMNLTEGMNEIQLSCLSEPQTGCLHDFQLTPEDVIALSKSDVFIINGAGAESFLAEVMKNYPELSIVDASQGISEKEEILMHGWMNPSIYHKQVEHIAMQLCELFPNQENAILKNLSKYIENIEAVQEQVKDLNQESQGQKVILFSEAFEGLVEAMDWDIVGGIDLDEERQISSGEVADIMEVVRQNPGCIILAEELYGGKLAETVKAQCEAKVLYLDPITRGEYRMDEYLKRMSQNLNTIEEALKP